MRALRRSTDVATPLTYERYTANWNGAFEGWALTTRSLTTRVADTLPAYPASV